MDDTKDLLKKYWPWVLGVLIAVYLIMKYSGSSSSSSGMDAYAAYVQGQAQIAATAANTSLQTATLQSQTDIANKQIALARDSAESQAQNDYLTAQGNVAQAIGTAASGLIGSLYQPYLSAMNSAAYENSAALASAAQIAVGGFATQSGMLSAGSDSIGAVAQGLNAFSNIQPQKSLASQVIGGVTSVANNAVMNPYPNLRGLYAG